MPISAAAIKAGSKLPDSCTTNPVTIGASAPPTNPPKSMMAPSEAAYCGGAHAVASDQDVPLAKKPKNMVADMAATAIVLLGVRAATSVASAIAAVPATVGNLRLLMAEAPRASSRLAIQPPAMLPITPQT